MNNPSHVLIHAAAAIPVGDEVEIQVVRQNEKKGAEAVVLRHLRTSVIYGPAGVFDSRPAHPLIGDPNLYLSPRIAPEWTIVRAFHARVQECVISNMSVDIGNGDSYVAARTSLLVEPIPPAQAYR